MTLDQTTLSLFSPFESGREVGRYRSKIHSVREFENYIQKENGVSDCFISVYNDYHEIDRILFDCDGDGFLRDQKRLFLWAYDNQFPAVPIVTAKKGMQVAILSKPFQVPNPKEILTDISWFIMREALGIKLWSDKTSIDPHLLGNVASLERVPNTLRPDLGNNSYCSYLPPYFTEMDEAEVFSYSKCPHTFNYSLSPRRSFLELPFDKTVDDMATVVPRSEHRYSSEFAPANSVEFLRRLLSPSMFARVTEPNPKHKARVAFAIQMFDFGYSVDEIVNVIRGLSWHDFSEAVTRSHLVYIQERFKSGDYHV